MSNATVFVCGATGIQGGALADILLSHSLRVHCLVRDPSAPAAQSLLSRGAKVYPGSYDDVDTLTEAITGCTTVFMNFMPVFNDLDAELRWAKTILKIAGDKGVKHVLYSSSFGLDDPTRLQGLEKGSLVEKIGQSKKNIEDEVRAAKHVPHWTLFRPGWFMANLVNPLAQIMCQGLTSPAGVWSVAFSPSTRLPMIDSTTMGRFTAAAVMDYERFDGMTITYCDELLSLEEVVAHVSEATGKALRVEYIPEEDIQAQVATNPFVQGQYISRTMGDMVDMKEVKKFGIELSSLQKYLEREQARVVQTYGPSS
ncbi:nmrA-like family protein [Sarocladium implicatum]|nr:nmrA-like family protein [Sarocladium implicatum]